MTRTYTMRKRAEASQATRDRIIAIMLSLCLDRWYDEITLGDVALGAGVSEQTVLNHFSSKDGVLEAMLADPRTEQAFAGRRHLAVPGDVAGAVRLLMGDYERVGDAVIRFLALESRVGALTPVLAFGRTGQRQWVETVFAEALEPTAGKERERRILQLLCATDIYQWQILRRDQGVSRQETTAVITAMVEAVYAHSQRPVDRRPRPSRRNTP